MIAADEISVYAISDEREVELKGEAVKVLKALEAVARHLRKFLVDQSVLPYFDKDVSQSRFRVIAGYIITRLRLG